MGNKCRAKGAKWQSTPYNPTNARMVNRKPYGAIEALTTLGSPKTGGSCRAVAYQG